jgi:hypothetical protein
VSLWLLVNLPPLSLLAVSAHCCHISARTLPHKCADTIRLVARMPGCATLWMAWNTVGLSTIDTSGLVMPRATSHSRLAPFTWTVLR